MENILRENKLKITKARLSILQVLKEENKPLSAEEIYDRAKKKHNLNLSTIYRNLSTLTDSGIILKNVNLDNFSYYQLHNKDHSHQLVCSICKRTISLDFCPVDDLIKDIEDKTNFEITGHSLEFMGICPECRNNIGGE